MLRPLQRRRRWLQQRHGRGGARGGSRPDDRPSPNFHFFCCATAAGALPDKSLNASALPSESSRTAKASARGATSFAAQVQGVATRASGSRQGHVPAFARRGGFGSVFTKDVYGKAGSGQGDGAHLIIFNVRLFIFRVALHIRGRLTKSRGSSLTPPRFLREGALVWSGFSLNIEEVLLDDHFDDFAL